MKNKLDSLIYDSSSAAELLNLVFNEIKVERPSYSLRAWAKKLRIPAGSLSRILAGQRKMPKKMLSHVPDYLRLDENQTAFFELLVMGSRNFTPRSFELIKKTLSQNWKSE